MSDRVGFIGVGHMGHGMAANILAAGHPLTIMGHRNRAPIDDLLARGACEAKSAREVAAASDIVFLCVTGSHQVEELALGPDGLMAANGAERADHGLTIVDCSTSDPVSTRRVASALADTGIAFADAPLGGTPKEAASGQLSMMVGASEATFARIEPLLRLCAASIARVGEVGAGHTMKLVNNFVSLGYAAIYSEALVLAKKAGVGPEVVDSVLRGSRMECGFYRTFMGYVLDRDPEAHKFTIRNGLKDLTYLESLAASVGLANPLGNAAKNAFAVATSLGRGDLYVPMLSDIVAELNGTSLAPARSGAPS